MCKNIGISDFLNKVERRRAWFGFLSFIPCSLCTLSKTMPLEALEMWRWAEATARVKFPWGVMLTSLLGQHILIQKTWAWQAVLSFLAILISFPVLILFFFFVSFPVYLFWPTCHQHKGNLFHAFCLSVCEVLLYFFRSHKDYSETGSALCLKISDAL